MVTSRGEVDTATVKAALIGSSIQKSRTPRMHMLEGAAQGFDYTYEIIDLDVVAGGADALPRLLDEVEAAGFAGVNVTHPCKQSVIPFLSDLTDETSAIGAVNTVIFRNGQRIGDNTDWWGYAEAFKRDLSSVNMDRVTLVGAGGAGLAVSYALLSLGVGRVEVVDLDPSRVADLVNRMAHIFGRDRIIGSQNVAHSIGGADGVVHTTPTGMLKYPGIAFDPNLLRPEHWVSEIVYVPLETELVRAAKQRGCKVSPGSGMAIFQAVRAFELITGKAADVERMYQHFSLTSTAH